MKYIFAIVFFSITTIGFAQINSDLQLNNVKTKGTSNFYTSDSTKVDTTSTAAWKNPNKITDYKMYTLENDTTYVDTSLTILKNYKFNYLREDDFELLPFSNVGQTYNRLSLHTNTDLFPEMGETGKYFSYFEVEDVKYYHVPTPVTELFFKTTFKQGQLLDASIAFNTSKEWSFYLAYKGMRSLGQYDNVDATSGNFRFSSNYHSKNDRYDLKMHFVGQKIFNQQNTGILNNDYFTSGDEDFEDRSRLEVITDDADNRVVGKRYFLQQQYDLVHSKDSTHYNSISIGNRFNYETKFYRYNQDEASDYYGDAYLSDDLEDRSKLRVMENQAFAKWSNNIIGDLGFKVINYNYNYLFTSITNIDGITIPGNYQGNETALQASYGKKIGGFDLHGSLAQTIVGELGGTKFYAETSYDFGEDNSLLASVSANSKMPNFNYLMYQSDYYNYNWYNVDTFEKEESKSLRAAIKLKKIANIDFEYSILNNYTYLAGESSEVDNDSISVVAPKQYAGTINYLKVKLQREFKVGKFALDNTIMYQQVVQDDDILNVPQLVTRNTFYYETPVFNKALFMQTGVTLKYFTKYYANRYNPLLSEFSIQNQTKIGEYPLFDVFLDFRIRQTRFFFKAEHINTLISKDYNYYSAPNNPYRDFVFRFGLVWNLFS
ncbi:Putative porin [Pustulibacterium marinum]|uniref:Putative porin n=1 Tax=Pustulibacterium marinum TaxID=1224947 RepID=A0A1I7FEP7_9FLAO|nr:putative porin [Pustulibacterium marinum]SFU34624.1 Putative porin [Pustulibacterium marinum]